MKLNKKQRAGKLGGQATRDKYGPDHFSNIGKMGAKVTHEKYKIIPWGLSQYAMVDRVTGTVRALLAPPPGWDEKDLPY